MNFYDKEEDLQCTISIRTIVKGTYSIQKGNSIQNDDVELSIHFSEKQKLSALYKYYECVMKMLSFMCFREEVEIDEVYLLQNKLHADLTKPIPTQVDLFGNLDRKKKAKYNIHEVNGDEQ